MALRAVTSNGVAITPSSVSLPTGGTFDLYNTADQTTNYERLRADWSGNVARIYTDAGGTGAWRNLTIGVASASNPLITLSRVGQGVTVTGVLTTVGNSQLIVNGMLIHSAGTTYGLNVSPTINQSGTAGYTALDINPTETATGSGAKLLQRWAVGGTAQAQINNAGATWAQSFNSVNGFGFTTSIGGSTDVVLARDAADTLALRRSTNAQTFRVYNTYTDGSNYRRWDLSWNTTTAIMQVVGAGTGGNGNLAVGNAALATNATVGYFMIPSSAGAPTGVPADIPTGQVALHFDSTNNKLYVYDGGWLSTAALT